MKRYDVSSVFQCGDKVMVEGPAGAWCKYSDVEDLIAAQGISDDGRAELAREVIRLKSFIKALRSELVGID